MGAAAEYSQRPVCLSLAFPALEAQIIRCPFTVVVEYELAGVVLVHALGVDLVDVYAALGKQLSGQRPGERYPLCGKEFIVLPKPKLALKCFTEVAVLCLAHHSAAAWTFADDGAAGREEKAGLSDRPVVGDKVTDHVFYVSDEAARIQLAAFYLLQSVLPL